MTPSPSTRKALCLENTKVVCFQRVGDGPWKVEACDPEVGQLRYMALEQIKAWLEASGQKWHWRRLKG